MLRIRMEAVFAERTRDEWIALLSDVEAAWAPVNTLGEMAEDPQLRARGMIAEVQTRDGLVLQIGIGPKFSGTPTGPIAAGVAPGTDTRAILRELGLSEEAIDQLAADDAILDAVG